ncbi:sensor histidine kinase [Sphingomonas sp. Sph1(2015)]|jgi:two-component system OmpR family sensor kinase|uniref:sensor histidine kinase n=1 Tax=Sphingomonas sp. Sph1(2015) TaxID=1628084 RepID=UPI001F519C91|nr:HAMP domain-containing sensor histidine kinase [Sphingomonas sp. Sph1(2015)]
MMRSVWRRPSALTAIGGFSVAIAVLSVAITASIVLLMPDPPAVRMTVADAVAALRGANAGLARTIGSPPGGSPAALLRPVLAQAVGRPIADVRVVWLDRSARPTRSGGVVVFTARGKGEAAGKMLWPGGTPPSGPVVIRRQGVLPMRIVPRGMTDSLIGKVLLSLPQPAFAASMRLADGRWLTVAPQSPTFGGWRLKVLVALVASLAVLAPLVWLFARRLTRPFRTLASAIDHGRDPPQAQGPRELQDAARAILHLRARLSAETDERMRMLTAVAHDLRTPLTSLKLRIEAVPEPQRARMAADADRMGAMIADVLDYARTANAPRHPVQVRTMVAEIVGDMPTVRLMDGPEVTVIAVEAAFRRAIENLVRNAEDYAGGSRVEVTHEDDIAIVRVVDAGPGIPPADRARLLRPFERGDASRSRDTGGVGLGLSIVQTFADLHGGTLSLDEAEGGGTIATLAVPALVQ